MPHCRVVAPGIVRLPLSDGDWIDVKRELTAGEYDDYLADMHARKKFSKAIQYLIGWSFVGLDGQPLPYALDLPDSVRRDTLGGLSTDTMRELYAALDKHEAAVDAALEAKKKTRPPAPASSPTSGSAAP